MANNKVKFGLSNCVMAVLNDDGTYSFIPNRNISALYSEKYEKYKKLYKTIKEIN